MQGVPILYCRQGRTGGILWRDLSRMTDDHPPEGRDHPLQRDATVKAGGQADGAIEYGGRFRIFRG